MQDRRVVLRILPLAEPRGACLNPCIGKPLEGDMSEAKSSLLVSAALCALPALRSDWSVDPFKLTEQDGYFYIRAYIAQMSDN